MSSKSLRFYKKIRHRCDFQYSIGGFIKGILRGARCTKSLRVLFLHRRPPSWTTLVLYSRAVFIFNEPALWWTFCPASEFVHKGAQLHRILRRKIPSWDFQAHYTEVFSLRSFDLSLCLGLPSSIQSHFPFISQHRSLTAIDLKLPLTYWFSLEMHVQ
jgi:hypothetical protein